MRTSSKKIVLFKKMNKCLRKTYSQLYFLLAFHKTENSGDSKPEKTKHLLVCFERLSLLCYLTLMEVNGESGCQAVSAVALLPQMVVKPASVPTKVSTWPSPGFTSLQHVSTISLSVARSRSTDLPTLRSSPRISGSYTIAQAHLSMILP